MRTSRPIRVAILSVLSLWLAFAPGLGAQTAGTEPRRFAILVGINQYADPGLVPLQKAQNDAEELGKALTRLGGYRAVTVMTGSLPYGDVNFPSKAKIVDRIEMLAGILRPDDQVLFFLCTIQLAPESTLK